MSGAVSRSDASFRRLRLADALAPVRVEAGIGASFSAAGATTRLGRLSEHGGYRLKFPDSPGPGVEAAIVNTGGGVAGGDRVRLGILAGTAARVTVATATAERVYRSAGPAAEIDVSLTADRGATLAWLPQATILFSGARLKRRYEADIAGDSRLVLAEAIVFGRIASGEVMGKGLLHDVWRVRRDGRLVFAEATRLDGDIEALLARPAVGGGARGLALLLCIAPGIEERRDAVRAAMSDLDVATGVSAWNGLLVVRALATELAALQSALRRAIGALQICVLPQVWPG
jgi:urease accessory protein